MNKSELDGNNYYTRFIAAYTANKHNEKLQTNLYEFYTDTVGSKDEDGIDTTATFATLAEYLKDCRDVYDLFNDSVIREVLFKELAKILKVDYATIYEVWLLEA